MSNELQRYTDEHLAHREKIEQERIQQERRHEILITQKAEEAAKQARENAAKKLQIRRGVGHIVVNIFEDAKQLRHIKPYPHKVIDYDPNDPSFVVFMWGNKLGPTKHEEDLMARYRKGGIHRIGFFPKSIINSHAARICAQIDDIWTDFEPGLMRFHSVDIISNPSMLIQPIAGVLAGLTPGNYVLLKKENYVVPDQAYSGETTFNRP